MIPTKFTKDGRTIRLYEVVRRNKKERDGSYQLIFAYTSFAKESNKAKRWLKFETLKYE